MYSSAVHESPEATLEQASTAKLERLCRILGLGFDEQFLRMWRYYLCYCYLGYSEGGFRERVISDVRLLFARPAYRGQPWRAPLRDDRAGARPAGGVAR